MSFSILTSCLIGYFIGAIPFGVLICRFYGVDILKTGSKNPGATNVKRVLGKKAGNLVFALDFSKGLIAAGLPLYFHFGDALPSTFAIYSLTSAIIGHSFSIFIRFKGGKGVATAMGGLAILMPKVLLVGALIWVLMFYGSRFVSIASLCFGLSLPASAFLFKYPPQEVFFCLLLMLFLLFSHRANIVRLWNGTENHFRK